jgi:hypothetical protein
MQNTLKQVAQVGMLLATLLIHTAHATLIDRGNGMIYDSVQDITWLQDANLAGTTMNWDDSVVWAAGLSVGGFDNWRLYNADPNCSRFNCTGNELGHLFYNEFNLTARQSISTATGAGLVNLNLFTNVQSNSYWSGTEFAPRPTLAWSFTTTFGEQLDNNKNGTAYVWAVRDGDVAAVPAPGTLAILGLGLLGLVVRKGQGRQRR